MQSLGQNLRLVEIHCNDMQLFSIGVIIYIFIDELFKVIHLLMTKFLELFRYT